MGTRLNAGIRTEVSVILTAYCEHRCPAKLKDKVRLEFRFRGNSVMVFEERPTFRRPAIWVDVVVPQFRFDSKSPLWTLYWANRNSRWFRYLDLDASKGDLFLFKLHKSPKTGHQDLIAGGGVFASFSILPISLAWEAFDTRNGAPSFSDMRRRLLQYRKIRDNPHEDFQVGCIILTQPFFSEDSMWFPAPDWNSSIVRGKAAGYELEKEAGRFIWNNLERAWRYGRVFGLDKEAERIEEERALYGKETTIKPRLGQGLLSRLIMVDSGHANGVRYLRVGGRRGHRFDGTSFQPQKPA